MWLCSAHRCNLSRGIFYINSCRYTHVFHSPPLSTSSLYVPVLHVHSMRCHCCECPILFPFHQRWRSNRSSRNVGVYLGVVQLGESLRANLALPLTSSTAIAYYDYLLTLGGEIELFWKKPRRSWAFTFFVANRYILVLGRLPTIAFLFWTLPENVRCVFVLGTSR